MSTKETLREEINLSLKENARNSLEIELRKISEKTRRDYFQVAEIFAHLINNLNKKGDDGKEIMKTDNKLQNLLLLELLEKHLALEEALEMSRLDPLTGLLNRRALEEAFFMLKKGDYSPISMAFLDLDDFKPVNSSEYVTGDKILKKIAEILKKSVRPFDFVGRIGGDEFIIFFHLSSEKSKKILERLLGEVSAIDIESLSGKNSPTWKSSFSAGICLFDKELSFEELLGRAGSALLEVKEQGKGKVFIFKP